MDNNNIKFPFEIVPVEHEINSELLEYYHGEKTGFVQVGPEKYFFPIKYKAEAEAYYNFQAREDDVWVVSFPRSGTTWTQEMVWLIANNLDFKKAKEQLLTERFPFFEFSLFMHPEIKSQLQKENGDNPSGIEFIEKCSCPGYKSFSDMPTNVRRFIKTHFPFSLLPRTVMERKCKVIYVARNPKDVCVSYYHLNRLFRTQGYVGDFQRFCTYFDNNLNSWMPYRSHIREAVEQSQMPNVLFLNYEDMQKDLTSAIRKVADFLDCQINSEDEKQLIEHLDISNFRSNNSVNANEMKMVGLLNPNEAGFVRNGGKHNN